MLVEAGKDQSQVSENGTTVPIHTSKGMRSGIDGGGGMSTPRGKYEGKATSILHTAQHPRKKMESSIKSHYKSRGSNYHDVPTGGRASILGGSSLNYGGPGGKDKHFGLMMN